MSEEPPGEPVEPPPAVPPPPPAVAAAGVPDDPRAAREARAAERAARRAGRPPAPEGERQGMLPTRERRRFAIERGFVRLIATGGIVGIAVLLGAVLVGQDVAGWIVGAVIGTTSVILAALLWSSKQL